MKSVFRFFIFITIIGVSFISCIELGFPLTGTVSISGHAQAGQTLTADVSSLRGSGVISFQWVRGGSTIIGSNSNTYTIQTADVGSTIIVVVTRSNNSGSITSLPTSTIIAAPVITISTQPAANTIVTAGNISGSLSVTASEIQGAVLNYQWYSNTTNNHLSGTGTVIDGATDASFTIPTTLRTGTYYYYCQVSTVGGAASIRSNVVSLIVSAPVITINTHPTYTTSVFTGNISGELSVTASVTGNAVLGYQWYSNTINSYTGGTIINGAANASFTIPATLTAGTYYYYCQVSAVDNQINDVDGTAIPVRSIVARVNVSVPEITINIHPAQTTSVFTGNISTELSVTASVTDGTALSYQWYSSTTHSNTGGEIINGAESSSFSIPTTLTAGTYYYFCEITATGGTTLRRTYVSTVCVFDSTMSSIGIEVVWIPSGSFELGRNLGTGGGSNVTPVSTVNISGFHMGKYPVTQEQYQAVMGTNPSNYTTANGRPPADGETDVRRPVEQVSWYDALVFCNKLSIMEGLTPAYIIHGGSTNPDDWGPIPTIIDSMWNMVQMLPGSTGYRLPTEAQWEYAAKGGDGSPGNFTYSGSNDPGAVAWYSINSGNITHEVGKKAPNGLGIYDMSGNILEWCWDRFGNYTNTTKTNPLGVLSGNYRVLRGGSCGTSASGIRSVHRDNWYPYSRQIQFGFRVSRP